MGFNWTASLGKIIKGQHTGEVIIDATGFEGEEVTVGVASVVLDPSCSTIASEAVVDNAALAIISNSIISASSRLVPTDAEGETDVFEALEYHARKN